jgi:hypothetical protein
MSGFRMRGSDGGGSSWQSFTFYVATWRRTYARPCDRTLIQLKYLSVWRAPTMEPSGEVGEDLGTLYCWR